MGTRAVVITVSDGVSAGTREDASGEAVERLLTEAGYEVSRDLVPDDEHRISAGILSACSQAPLVLTTGGTGFGRRDVTPEATAAILEREAPGLVHVMLAEGLTATPLAALTRARAGTIGESLVINLPGSPKGATESLAAVIELLPHVLQLLGGDNRHH